MLVAYFCCISQEKTFDYASTTNNTPYRSDAILDYFTHFADQPWSMLLHSGYGNNHDTRYDILVAAPAVILVTRDSITKICCMEMCELRDDDPFTLVQEQLAAAHVIALPNIELPFQGGALGYFGYDLVRNIEILPVLAQQDLSLLDMAIGIYRWAVVADRFKRSVILISHDDPGPILLPN